MLQQKLNIFPIQYFGNLELKLIIPKSITGTSLLLYWSYWIFVIKEWTPRAGLYQLLCNAQ